LKACEDLGIDGATVSILTPFPGTPLYQQLKEENRLLSSDWSDYNGKTKVVFQPRNMPPEELFEGYMWFRKKFYSLPSIIRRLVRSRTNVIYPLMLNLGYKFCLRN